MSGSAAERKRQGGSASLRSDALCSEHLNLVAQTHRSSVWETLSRVCNLRLEAVEQQSKRGGLTPAGHTAHCRTWTRHKGPELIASAALQLLQGQKKKNKPKTSFRDSGNPEHLKGRLLHLPKEENLVCFQNISRDNWSQEFQ